MYLAESAIKKWIDNRVERDKIREPECPAVEQRVAFRVKIFPQ